MKGYVILISVVAALGGLLFGFDTAVISGTINFIQGLCYPEDTNRITDEKSSA